jgi:hypothetical protein
VNRIAEPGFKIILDLVLDGDPCGLSQFEKGLNTFHPAALGYIKPFKSPPPSHKGLMKRVDAVKKVTH